MFEALKTLLGACLAVGCGSAVTMGVFEGFIENFIKKISASVEKFFYFAKPFDFNQFSITSATS